MQAIRSVYVSISAWASPACEGAGAGWSISRRMWSVAASCRGVARNLLSASGSAPRRSSAAAAAKCPRSAAQCSGVISSMSRASTCPPPHHTLTPYFILYSCGWYIHSIWNHASTHLGHSNVTKHAFTRSKCLEPGRHAHR